MFHEVPKHGNMETPKVTFLKLWEQMKTTWFPKSFPYKGDPTTRVCDQ